MMALVWSFIERIPVAASNPTPENREALPQKFLFSLYIEETVVVLPHVQAKTEKSMKKIQAQDICTHIHTSIHSI